MGIVAQWVIGMSSSHNGMLVLVLCTLFPMKLPAKCIWLAVDDAQVLGFLSLVVDLDGVSGSRVQPSPNYCDIWSVNQQTVSLSHSLSFYPSNK